MSLKYFLNDPYHFTIVLEKEAQTAWKQSMVYNAWLRTDLGITHLLVLVVGLGLEEFVHFGFKIFKETVRISRVN